jgi:phosphoglycolate phosphatase
VKSARNANMLSIIVRGGYTNIAPELLGADAVIDSFDDLFIALEELAT